MKQAPSCENGYNCKTVLVNVTSITNIGHKAFKNMLKPVNSISHLYRMVKLPQRL